MDDKLREQMAQDAGAGFEDMEAQDFSAPFLIIIQPNSPCMMRDNPAYLEEARPGFILNTQSNKVYKEVHVVPCKFSFRTVEWKDRNVGQGGFVKSYERGEEPTDLVTDPLTGRIKRKNGNIIQQTSYYLAMLEEEGNDRVIIPMYSTQLKKARKWNATMQAQKFAVSNGNAIAPMFSYWYKLSTVSEKNNKGTWYGWLIQLDRPVNDLVTYNSGKATHQIENFLPERLLAAMAPAEEGQSDLDNGSDEAM